MRIALVGQPNCGKSTLFNVVAGYKTVASNFPGTTVECFSSKVTCGGETFELVDIPGLYSITSDIDDELQARKTIVDLEPDAIVNVIDASLLARSLELTLELLELGLPCVVCLNMMDEAGRKGTDIDVNRLQEQLGVPVVPTVATLGRGVTELFRSALETASTGRKGKGLLLSRDVEVLVEELMSRIGADTAAGLGLPTRFLALKLLEQDDDIEREVLGRRPDLEADIERLRAEIEKTHGRPADVVLASERHALTLNLFESVARVTSRKTKPLGERVDRYVLHPFLGYAILVLILLGFFYLVFGLGKLIETPILGIFDRLTHLLDVLLPESSIAHGMALGLVQGLSGGIGIVLPYLVPFLAGLSLLEDVGYIPRAAFLMDAIMHRIGLHGKAIIPFVLGYGCTVPAVMGARTMESSRDRFVTALLVNFIPCAARTTVIFAVVGFFLGPGPALFLYLFNVIVIAAVGKIILHFRPEASPGLILDIPSYRLPSPGVVARKVWFRLREFIVIAWPLLIAGSVILSLMDHFKLSGAVNNLLAPFTSTVLGLPPETGVTLIFGILRKELTVVMLVQALGTSDFASVLTTGQMMVFTVFTIFYFPCLATLAMLRSVIGLRSTLFVMIFTAATATLLAVLFRLAFRLMM